MKRTFVDVNFAVGLVCAGCLFVIVGAGALGLPNAKGAAAWGIVLLAGLTFALISIKLRQERSAHIKGMELIQAHDAGYREGYSKGLMDVQAVLDKQGKAAPEESTPEEDAPEPEPARTPQFTFRAPLPNVSPVRVKATPDQARRVLSESLYD